MNPYGLFFPFEVCVYIYVCIIDADSRLWRVGIIFPGRWFAHPYENGIGGSRFLIALYCYSPKWLTPPQQQIAVSKPSTFWKTSAFDNDLDDIISRSE